jgi:structural maintenance of chromosome 4
LIVEEQQLAEVVRNLRTQLEESKSSAQTAKRSSALLEGLMQAKQKKKLAGVFGRLGDLGTINAKYELPSRLLAGL